jgi:hypothetical protein
MRYMLTFRDEHYCMYQIRRRITWFARRLGKEPGPRGMPVGCRPLKALVRDAKTPQQVYDALDEFAAGGLRGAEPVSASEAE